MIRAIERKIALPMVLILIIGLGTEVRLFFTADGSLKAILMAVLLVIQLIAAISDLSTGLIPLWLVFPAFVLGMLIILIFDGNSSMLGHILGGVLSFFIFAFFMVLTRGQIGGGDLLLFALTGFFLGFSMIPGILFLSIILSGMFSVFLIVFKKTGLKTEIPFAPFILLATAILNF
ncbi:prepilin peptidase [Ruminiclostridium cellobioparum]|uniref:prepilin peptidase n=1 Tax=Ruminiclostridium cellobioparum TaxID=29355 RepID=UPI0006871360|nr:A24 family peptidase [Ruminiclostridium cellobioparum]